MAMLNGEPVDLMFLDIQMPGLTGVEFLKSMKTRPLVIFTTAYPDYALEGYALDVVDYLLKPFSFERFVQAVSKAAGLLALLSGQPAPPLTAGQGQLPAGKDYILVKADYKIYRIRFDDILFIQSMREYVAYHTPKGRILSLNSLKSLEEELPGDRFLRIHKSYIVPVDKIDTLEGNMVHVGKEKLPIGASYREEVMGKVFK
jgi:two-component system, LytTR family, response regulator